jgi:hypothetical protein
MDPSRPIMLYGTDEPVPAPRVLRAGGLEASLANGNLRYIRVGGREVLRAIAFLVRDRNWGTFNPAIEDLAVEETPDLFVVTYRATVGTADESLRYTARIEGRADGRLDFSAEGEPLTDFVTNRTGFVVLHALEDVVGRPVTVEHTDGRVEQSHFPRIVNPACPFEDVRALTHEVAPGLRAVCRMEGDAFEMEDHRNWMDASFKTYVRPLALPWPYTLPRGETFRQSVTLRLEGTLPAAASAGGQEAVTISIGAPTGRAMPPLGLAVDGAEAAAGLRQAALLKTLAPAHLVCRFDARKRHDATTMAAFRDLGEALGADLVLEAVLPCETAEGAPTADVDVLKRDMAVVRDAATAAGVRFSRVAVSPATDLKCTLPGSAFPPAPSWAELIGEARRAFPDVPVGGGMFSYFTELNRKRPPADLMDFVCHTVCPLVHAGDDVSVSETLEALPSIFGSARALAGAKPYWLFPSAIAMRENPYGAAPAENPGNIRQAMNRVDPRERGLIGAAWYAGLLAEAAAGGPDALTLAAIGGPSSVLYERLPEAQPWFDAREASVYPKFIVLQGHARLVGSTLLATTSSVPGVRALAVERNGRRHLWLTNQTPSPVEITLAGAKAGVARVLDETSFAALCRDPAGWSAAARPAPALRLGAYAVAEIELA